MTNTDLVRAAGLLAELLALAEKAGASVRVELDGVTLVQDGAEPRWLGPTAEEGLPRLRALVDPKPRRDGG